MSKKSGSRNPAKHSRFHDFNINCCDLHRHRSALDCFCRLLVGVVLLIGSYYIGWSFAVLPVGVFLLSVYIWLTICADVRSRLRRA
jgi:hypothetical protein